MMIGFGAVAFYRWYQTQLLFFLLLVLRDFVAGYFFVKRKPAQEKASLIPRMMAYVSSAMPLLYLGPTVDTKSLFLASDLLAILGFLVVAFATAELGTSIGISPAKRGLVRNGIYHYIKHPMYLGYVVSELGLVILNPLNAALFGFSISFYIFRGLSENRILGPAEKVETTNRISL